MYTDNLTAIREFILVFAAGLFLAATVHSVHRVLSDILCMGRLSDVLCCSLILMSFSYTVYSLNSLRLQYHLFVAYAAAFTVYRHSFYYLTDAILSALFSLCVHIFRKGEKIFRPPINIFLAKADAAKKILNSVYSLSQQIKKVYNKNIKYFSRRRKNEEEQKTEKS